MVGHGYPIRRWIVPVGGFPNSATIAAQVDDVGVAWVHGDNLGASDWETELPSRRNNWGRADRGPFRPVEGRDYRGKRALLQAFEAGPISRRHAALSRPAQPRFHQG